MMGTMDWLNYHHLRYFWVVAREGSISAACKTLHLAQPTISAQLRRLERALGAKLFSRSGRGLVLTDAGREVFRYAEEIFALGRELVDVVEGRSTRPAERFNVGVADVVSKLIAYRLLSPAMTQDEPVRVVCFEGKPVDLLGRLATHDLDLVLTDQPLTPEMNVRAYNHEIGECDVTVFGAPTLAREHRRKFPRSLEGAPFLLPTRTTALRRNLDSWFERQGIRPRVVGEFEDSALMKAFGQAGEGLFVGPSAIESEVISQYRVRSIGRIAEIRERYYAISVERRVTHPAVRLLVRSGRDRLFAASPEGSAPGRKPRKP